ncbi:MAG TPA: hypothetical protein VHY20_08960 [Pirellulales bacterium]|jgi:hypothetical protein|nr:hypothetical protein [Pirellulales bacterium]
MPAEPEARLFKTDRGMFRLFEHGAITSEPDRTCVMDVHRGQRYDFASQADALAWINGAAGAPQPLPMSEPTAEEIAEWEALEAEIDEKYGTDADPLADL